MPDFRSFRHFGSLWYEVGDVRLHRQSVEATCLISCIVISFVFTFVGCGNDDDDEDAIIDMSESKLDLNWQIQSAAFAEGQEIPARFTCDGEDISPTLSWSDPPPGTQSLALLMDDPDAGVIFTHWLLYNLPIDLRRLNENIPTQLTLAELGNANQGENDFGRVGYGGPCPPVGETHRYRFRLFALDFRPNLSPELSRLALFDAIDNHVLAEARLTGVFSR